MLEKIYLYFLILCAISSRIVFGTFVEDDIEKSSNLLVREKRVISRTPDEDIPVGMGDVSYLANIRKNKRLHCVGSILSHHTVITAARCVASDLRNYEVVCGSTLGNKGVPHAITHREIRGHDPSTLSIFQKGIALIQVEPSIKYRNTVSYINLHAEPVLAGVSGTISGWASFVYGGSCESRFPHKLRSINVPIMNHQECHNIYRGLFSITDEVFCTYHAQKQCGLTDLGAPFVINNKLVGVHIGGIDTAGRVLPIKPDVFVLLQHSEYRQWIHTNIVD